MFAALKQAPRALAQHAPKAAAAQKPSSPAPAADPPPPSLATAPARRQPAAPPPTQSPPPPSFASSSSAGLGSPAASSVLSLSPPSSSSKAVIDAPSPSPDANAGAVPYPPSLPEHVLSFLLSYPTAKRRPTIWSNADFYLAHAGRPPPPPLSAAAAADAADDADARGFRVGPGSRPKPGPPSRESPSGFGVSWCLEQLHNDPGRMFNEPSVPPPVPAFSGSPGAVVREADSPSVPRLPLGACSQLWSCPSLPSLPSLPFSLPSLPFSQTLTPSPPERRNAGLFPLPTDPADGFAAPLQAHEVGSILSSPLAVRRLERAHVLVRPLPPFLSARPGARPN